MEVHAAFDSQKANPKMKLQHEISYFLNLRVQKGHTYNFLHITFSESLLI